MNTEELKQKCLSRLRSLRFDLLGNENLVKLADELQALIEKQDFDSNAGQSRRERRDMMDKITVEPDAVFEMNDGGRIEGKIFAVRSGEIVFFTEDGIRNVPFLQVPDEMRGNLGALPIEYVLAEAVEPLKKMNFEKEAYCRKLLTELEKYVSIGNEYRVLNGELKKRLEDLGEL